MQGPQLTYRLPKAHLVSQDPIEAVVVQRDQPLDALQLVRAQVALDEGDQLLLHLHAPHSRQQVSMTFSTIVSPVQRHQCKRLTRRGVQAVTGVHEN